MGLITDLQLIQTTISEILCGASFDKFSYSGIYTLYFTLPNKRHGIELCNIDVATDILVLPNDQDGKTDFLMEDLLKIYGSTITKVKLDQDLSLNLFFDNSFVCIVSSYLEDKEGLIDLRWELYEFTEVKSLSIRVTNEEEIYLRIP